MFELALPVDLLLVRPFALLEVGFPAAADILVDVALLLTLRYMRWQERALVGAVSAPAAATDAGAPATPSGAPAPP